MLGNLLKKGPATQSTTSLSDFNLHPSGSMTATDSLLVNAGRNDPIYGHQPTSNSRIVDHMADESKVRLFGSKTLPQNCAASSSSFLLMGNNSSNNKINDSFRLFIAEETGQMSCRNNYRVVLDHLTIKGSTMEQIRPNELKEYIFGSPVRASDSSQSDKFRIIPNSGFAMVTRIFYFENHVNRLAVCLCVPASLLPTISEAWNQVSFWFDGTQHFILSLLNKIHYKKPYNEDKGLLPADLKLQFPNDYNMLVSLLEKKLLPCLRSMSDITRLFLYPAEYKGFVETWFKDVFDWIEIKDGPRINFLPTLLAEIIVDFKDNINDSDPTRIAITSGNMVVANKLIFIVSGILKPRYNGPADLSYISKNNCKLLNKQNEPVTDSVSDLSTLTTVGTNSTLTQERPGLQNAQSTTRGWEIPRRTSYNSVASVSSGESLAEVIQPSSFKSGSSSLHHLYSSLSSHHGSYGSWLSKRPTMYHPLQPDSSVASNDSSERISTLQRTTSSTSLVGAREPFGVTPQPSPSISEYDSYPWFGMQFSPKFDSITATPTPITTPNIMHANGSGISSKAPTKWCKNRINYKMPMDFIEINRDSQRISQELTIDEAFDSICKPHGMLDTGFSVTTGNSMHAAVLDIDCFEAEYKTSPCELLPRYTSYLPNFNRWFKLQAFPISSDSESKVISVMKKDLQLNPYSRTLLVSLGSREIKEITIKKDTYQDGSPRILQRNKKIYSNGKCRYASSKLEDCTTFVESCIIKAMTLYNDADLDPGERDEEMLRIFHSFLD